jgi:hypothetical protein
VKGSEEALAKYVKHWQTQEKYSHHPYPAGSFRDLLPREQQEPDCGGHHLESYDSSEDA